MALYHFTTKPFSRGTRNTVGALAYRAGCKLYDNQTGEPFNYQSKEVQHVELLLPEMAPQWALDIQKLMSDDRQKGVQALVDIVEGAETRINSRVWREFEFALHRELTKDQNITLAKEFVQDQICSRGMAAQLNFHFDIDEETGEEKPHCHVVVTTRLLEESGMGAKERNWNKKELLCELRQLWQEYSNFHLKLHGHDIQIDHRSNKDRGIEMEPQPKRGRGVLEQERRHQNSPTLVTDKAKAFHDVQLRNLYRILRNPDVVFDIVTKHHATFMWADVQKKLHQYVDEAPLFQRLEAKLKNSNELLPLRTDSEDKAIYTTRTMLKAERSLVEKAETLGACKTHSVEENHIEHAIAKANEGLGGNLSADQVKAIHHLVDEGQLKCVVGIAGAGKTTALGVCQEIWQNGGYAVYGLTPTGKAAQNLEQSGISSMTLHKFLKSFNEGRCQYNENSILVLDEAGMVDVERFEKLLGAVQKLGVKLIVVGDGAQLQPVEAGPAFRLVTTRLGKSELNTVLRQKEDWQKEATVLFGQQKTAEALQRYMDKGRIHLIEEETAHPRQNAKEALVQAWHEDSKTAPEENFLILAHTNRDVKDLNIMARTLLKESGQLSQKEFIFMIKKEDQDDFGKKQVKQEEKGFSQGDRIVFTRNNYGLGVKNGSMGTILDLNKQKVLVKLDEGKEVFFAPNLNPYFDQGWAITIHKSQGTTVDKTYVLASSSMTQNLSYVAMTRHRENVQV
ncbi:MAG: Ti-type conjugative transfer relaxase TraA, partial [Alphaproteobacteria bacterium RIFCSPLOWO2_02_42_7]